MKITRSGPVDSEGYLMDKSGERKEKFNPNKPSNVMYVYFWYLDLQGRLHQEDRAPAPYHGMPRLYVREDVERTGQDELTSRMRVYYGKDLKAETEIRTPEYPDEDNPDIRYNVKKLANFLLTEGGWRFYQPEGAEGKSRRVKKTHAIKRSSPHKKVRKVVSKKVKKVTSKKKRK